MAGRQVVLAYHSVSSARCPAVLGSFPIPLARFQHQIRAAREQGWQFGSLRELRRPAHRDTLYITGDDGTIDWVRNVLPWCEKEGLPTHTAIITGPWLTSPVYPVAHRLQILLCLPGRELPIPALTPDQADYVDRVYAYETDARRRRLKGACNVVLDDAAARELLGPPDEEERRLLQERFAQPAEYQGYSLAEFGPHTVSHRAFDGDVYSYVHNEILPCVGEMHRHGLVSTAYLTLPMRPRFPATVEQLVPALQGRGFAGVLDAAGEWDRRSFVVPRIDAKNVEAFLGLPPFGQGAEHDTPALAGTALSR